MASRVALVVVACVMLSGCDIDPFNAGCRDIADTGYALCVWEDDKTYYLAAAGERVAGGGVLEGTVQSIGWNTNVIVASRHATFGGDPDGLMVVDLKSNALSGPFDAKEILRRYPTIDLAAPDKAWAGLKRAWSPK